MVMIHTFKILFLCLNAWYSANEKSEKEFKLIVEIDNIKHTSGQEIQIAIDKKNNFLEDGVPFRYAKADTKSSRISETFILPVGEYAVSVYHDVNGNGKMDKNFFGAPSEPYAFSKNYKPVFRAPRFDEVKVHLTGDRKINISLIQP